jgi:hypothetical protein
MCGMQQSDLDGITRSGAQARARGASFFDNPHLISDAPFDNQWMTVVDAWSTGWLQEDAGRDPQMQALARVRYW